MVIYGARDLTARSQARDLLAQAAAAEWGLSPLPDIARHPGGKPYFPDHPSLHFNLSHSGGLALCALDAAPVGVDIQVVKTLRPALPRRVCSPEELAWLEELRGRTYNDQGQERPWITGEEYAMLSIRKGTLSPEERKIMEDHVVVTDTLLSQIHFSKELSHVREWAASHHELLNGSGYPRHLSGEQVPYEVRIITILDIFDALVADDRPYKPGMPIEKALDILTIMATKEGKLDPRLTELFIESKCWVLEN